MIQILIFTLLLNYSLASNPNYINVQSFGAKSNGKSDCTKAFLGAWAAACASTKPATIHVPIGRYLLGRTVFSGNKCMNKAITIRIDGTLVAPSDYKVLGAAGRDWLEFQYVTGVSIYGGTLDGQGTGLWACKKSTKSSCPQGATSLGLYDSNDITIDGLRSINSQLFHIIIYGCRNTKLNNTKISAPKNSPNTDGIHIAKSSAITILNTRIATGDDCVSIGGGTSELWIENVLCGPGHGISIGSLGSDMKETGVQNVTVKTVKLIGTQNGLRIKTWAKPSNAFVRHVLFQHIVTVNAQNPIIIDQNYCPGHRNCPKQGSGVKISDITYKDIHGTSASQVAVKLDCSKAEPCTGIKMDDIKVTYKNKSAMASCVNAKVIASNVVLPKSCF